jgi:hypothetical protein
MVSAQEFAQSWHGTLFEQDMNQTWRLMTEDFRRVVAQIALGKARERGENVDAVLDDLSSACPERGDLKEFFGAASAIMQKACVVPPDLVGAGITARVEAPAYEVVRLYVLEDLAVDEVGHRYLPSEASARALTLITCAEKFGSWRMAGIGAVMTPGWPPTVAWEPPATV